MNCTTAAAIDRAEIGSMIKSTKLRAEKNLTRRRAGRCMIAWHFEKNKKRGESGSCDTALLEIRTRRKPHHRPRGPVASLVQPYIEAASASLHDQFRQEQGWGSDKLSPTIIDSLSLSP
jgi:hypothetical protein